MAATVGRPYSAQVGDVLLTEERPDGVELEGSYWDV